MDGNEQEQQQQVSRAAVIEVLGRDGQVRSVHKIQRWPATIGRSPECDVVLDDAHMAGEHAALSWSDEAGPQLQLLPSINGGWAGERRLAVGESATLSGTALFQLGATQLRWRSTASPLAPELPLERHQHQSVKPSALWLAVALPVWLFSLAFEQWLATDPGTPLIDYTAPVLGPLGAVLAWAALWALVTQLFQHRFPFATHLRRVLVWLLAVYALGIVVPAVAYALSLPRLLAVEEVVTLVGSAGLIWWHAVVVWPRARQRLAIALGVLLVLGMGLMTARRQDQQHWLGPNYLSALPPPALRMVSPKSPESLIEQLKPLQGQLQKQAKKDSDQAPAEEE
jgi:hypothetical protein